MRSKIPTSGMWDAQMQGISGVVSDAEDAGAVILTKYGRPHALIIPLTAVGFSRWNSLLLDVLATPALRRKYPELVLLAESLSGKPQ